MSEKYDTWKIKEIGQTDIYKGWVRINKNDRVDIDGKIIKRKDLIIIEKEDCKSKIIRRVLGKNNKKNNKKIIWMDFDTRYNDKLWNLESDNEYELRIKRISKFDLIHISCFYWNHPDTAIRIAFKLGLFSIFIAILALM